MNIKNLISPQSLVSLILFVSSTSFWISDPSRNIAGIISIASLLSTSFFSLLNWRKSKEINLRVSKTESDIESVILGRRLSEEEKEKIEGLLKPIDLNKVDASIIFIEHEVDSKVFADSLFNFFKNRLGIRCRLISRSRDKYPEFFNTKAVFKSDADESALALVDALDSTVEEIDKIGEGTYGIPQFPSHVIIVISKKK